MNEVRRARDVQMLAHAKRAIEEMLERVRNQKAPEPRPLTAKTGVRVP